MKAAYKDYIQYALDANKPLPDSLSDNEWRGLYSFCCRQGIPGIVFSGIEGANKPVPQDVILEWFALVEGVKRQNQLVNKRLLALSDWFKEKGYRSIILKGQANGTMYPKPELRCSGDIDVWVEGDVKDIIKLVREKCPNAHYSIHHIKMPVFNDVSVEVHYRPIYLINWFLDKRLQRHIKSIEESQFNNRVLLESLQIGSLTDDFNAVYQLLHMYAHFFSTRNNFKQFVDYYYLLKRGLTDEQKKESAALMKELKVLKYGRGMMWVMKEVLGLDESL